jgi:hypothetical protein
MNETTQPPEEEIKKAQIFAGIENANFDTKYAPIVARLKTEMSLAETIGDDVAANLSREQIRSTLKEFYQSARIDAEYIKTIIQGIRTYLAYIQKNPEGRAIMATGDKPFSIEALAITLGKEVIEAEIKTKKQRCVVISDSMIPNMLVVTAEDGWLQAIPKQEQKN